MITTLILQGLFTALLIGAGIIIYKIITGVMTYAVLKPTVAGVKLPIRIFRAIKGYFTDKEFRKELKAIKHEGDKLRLLEDMKNPIILEKPSVKKFALARQNKQNKKDLKQVKKNGKDNFDKVVK